MLKDRTADKYFDGIKARGIATDGRIPDFRRLTEVLWQATKWEIVPVAGLIPDDSFFNHLTHRRFPATTFIRTWAQLDYLQEPDVFTMSSATYQCCFSRYLPITYKPTVAAA